MQYGTKGKADAPMLYGTMLSPHWGNAGYKVGSRPGQPGARRVSTGRPELPCYVSEPRPEGNVMLIRAERRNHE